MQSSLVVSIVTSSDRDRSRRTGLFLVFISVLSNLLVLGSAQAGGLYVNEFSTTSQANAGAGRGAWVPDASAALHNPASMTQLVDHAFAGGFSVALGNVHFNAESTSPSGTGNGGNQAGVAPIASSNYVHRISDRVRFGLSFFSISGSILNPSNDWAGRFELTKISLLTISLSPTIAIRVTDWLSVGGGPVATYGVLDWNLKAPFPIVPVGSESDVRLDNLDDWQAAGRVGVLIHPSESFKLSVYYNSKTDFNFDGRLDGPTGLTRNLNAKLPLAQFVEVSGYWQATERLALLATFNWEDWSVADDLDITLGAASLSATTGFEDTYKFGIGANYQWTANWLLQTGLMYDTSALKNRNRITSLPVDDQIRVAIGAQYRLDGSRSLGLSFVYLNLGQGEIRQASVRGDYDRNHAFILGLTLAFNSLPWSDVK